MIKLLIGDINGFLLITVDSIELSLDSLNFSKYGLITGTVIIFGAAKAWPTNARRINGRILVIRMCSPSNYGNGLRASRLQQR